MRPDETDDVTLDPGLPRCWPSVGSAGRAVVSRFSSDTRGVDAPRPRHAVERTRRVEMAGRPRGHAAEPSGLMGRD